MASQREIRLTGDNPILYRSITQDEGGAVAARQHHVTTITDAGEAVLERTHEQLLCERYGFDQLRIERDSPYGYATVTAERGGCRVQACIAPAELDIGSADIWHRCYATLVREFERRGATPPERTQRPQ